jgi:surface antigen
MLVEQQLESVPGCVELSRALTAATDGPGAGGVLTMQIVDRLGTIDSVSRSRIITTDEETMIAQLTVTALEASPVDRAHVWLTVRSGGARGVISAAHHRRGAPVNERRDTL